ncbi:MAG: protein phosphatase CheZ, partial [Gammaproteobacteria bacterium]
LVTALERGNDAKANGILERIAASREANLFVEIGKLTRGLHNAMLTIRLDARLIGITKTDIPDAKERLNAVITRTEEAAHRTLNAVEELLPIVDTMAINADKILDLHRRQTRETTQFDIAGAGDHRFTDFIVKVKADSQKLHKNLSEVLMAQDFQDLTGQVIRRVIEVVQEVECSLVDMIRISSTRRNARVKKSNGVHVAGSAPTMADEESKASTQDEVDSLLSSLGF